MKIYNILHVLHKHIIIITRFYNWISLGHFCDNSSQSNVSHFQFHGHSLLNSAKIKSKCHIQVDEAQSLHDTRENVIEAENLTDYYCHKSKKIADVWKNLID